ncbi:MAG: hypothetical protein VX498_14290 [Myxococcota bacterium]|nr:hypothetical protein [Myxococcota bacterium]
MSATRCWCFAVGLVLLLSSGLGLSSPVEAAPVELFGSSVRAAGLAGGGGALDDGAASLAVQAAALGLGERDHLRLHYLGGRIFLDPVDGVTRLDGEDEAMPVVSVQPQVLSADFAKGVGPWARVGVQASLSVPFLYSHETKDPWVPYSMRWQNRVARSVASAGAAVRIPVRGVKSEGRPLQGGLWFGFALSVRPRGIIEVDLDLSGVAGAGGDGEAAVEATLKNVVLSARYVLRPHFSLLLDFGTFAPSLDGVRLALAYQPETTTDISPILLDVAVLNLSEANAVFSLVDRLQATVALGLTDFYDPHEVRISLAAERPRFAVSADLRIALWSRLGPSYGRVVEDSDSSLVIAFASGESASYPVISGRFVEGDEFRDAVELSLGGEGRFPGGIGRQGKRKADLRVRGGFRYLQSAVRPQAGRLGTIDGDAMTAALGLGLRFPLHSKNERLGPLELDWAIQGTRLLPVKLVGPAATEGLDSELPVAWSEDPHWPGGWVLVSGVSLGLGF